MKRLLPLLFAGLALTGCHTSATTEYVIVAGPGIADDPAWSTVVEALRESHPDAAVLRYDAQPRDVLPELRRRAPRYVAFVERPERIGRDYIIDLNRMSREADEDIYGDYLWGVVTGYDADAAREMVLNAREPLVIRSAVSTLHEVGSGKWFETFGYLHDFEPGLCGRKEAGTDSVCHYRTRFVRADGKPDLLREFQTLYADIDPDLILSASHATERNLEMPFSLGNLRARGGELCADFAEGPEPLRETGKRRVYLPVGNCLIGNMDHTRESMAAAWMRSAHAAAMAGYVVPTWYGRNGWGGLKYWLTTPGRYTLFEAFYLNRQDMLHQLAARCPQLTDKAFPYGERFDFDAMTQAANRLAGRELDEDELGFFFDRDVVALYGDPAWDVRLQALPAERDFTVTMRTEGCRRIVNVATLKHFSAERMAGNRFKEEHVRELPFSYFFPERLAAPRLAAGQPWKAAVDENFLLVYDPGFEPGRNYEIVLETGR